MGAAVVGHDKSSGEKVGWWRRYRTAQAIRKRLTSGWWGGGVGVGGVGMPSRVGVRQGGVAGR